MSRNDLPWVERRVRPTPDATSPTPDTASEPLPPDPGGRANQSGDNLLPQGPSGDRPVVPPEPGPVETFGPGVRSQADTDSCPRCRGPLTGRPTHCPGCGLPLVQGQPEPLETPSGFSPGGRERREGVVLHVQQSEMRLRRPRPSLALAALVSAFAPLLGLGVLVLLLYLFLTRVMVTMQDLAGIGDALLRSCGGPFIGSLLLLVVIVFIFKSFVGTGVGGRQGSGVLPEILGFLMGLVVRLIRLVLTCCQRFVTQLLYLRLYRRDGEPRSVPVRIVDVTEDSGSRFQFRIEDEVTRGGFHEGDRIRVEGVFRGGYCTPHRIWNLSAGEIEVRWRGQSIWSG